MITLEESDTCAGLIASVTESAALQWVHDPVFNAMHTRECQHAMYGMYAVSAWSLPFTVLPGPYP